MKQVRNVSIIALYNDDRKMLLQHRDENINILPGCWSFFGGKVEENEAPDDAVKRETMEELEYKLINPKLVMTEKFETDIYDVTRYIYVEKYDPRVKLVLHEGQNMGWYDYSEIGKFKIDPIDLKIIKFVDELIKK